MMNGVTRIGVNTQNYQTAFKAKDCKAAYEFIDQMSDAAKEITRPIAEKKVNMIRRYVSKFMSFFKSESKNNEIKDEYCKGLIEEAKTEGLDPERAKTRLINHTLLTGNFSEGKKTLKLIEQINEAHRQAYLEKLKETNQGLYEEVLRRDAEHKVMSMTNMQILQQFIKNLFKKS